MILSAAAATVVLIAAPAAAAGTGVITTAAVPAVVIGRFTGAILLPVFPTIFLSGCFARLPGNGLGARQRCEGRGSDGN